MPIKGPEGVILGATHHQEWLLPWWWMNYRVHNSHPVTFFNFGGMSDAALGWCLKRGEVVEMNDTGALVANKDAVEPEAAQVWQEMNPDVWTARTSWFKKPLAMSRTPYQRTLWLDLDCQVRGSLAPLFLLCDNPAGLAVCPEAAVHQEVCQSRNLLLPGEVMHNSGVVVFDRESPIIKKWVQLALEQSHLFIGDQQLLTRILFLEELDFHPLPPLYNWPVDLGLNHDAVILHWYGRAKEPLPEFIKIVHDTLHVNLEWTDPAAQINRV